MKFSELVENEKVKARKKNIETVRKEISTTDVVNKIKNFLTRFDGLFSFEEIVERILTDDLTAAFFAKDPAKQNISENLVSKVLGIEKLPAGGKNSIRFNSKGDIVHTASEGSKSADFLINGIYYTQKYTGENSGGAQDNQYRDVVEFLTNGSIKNKVGAIIDGWYWDKNGKRAALQELFKDNSNVIIRSVDELNEEIHNG